MRKIGWIAAGMALAVMAGGCGEAAGDPAAESSTLLPGFSSESELIGFLIGEGGVANVYRLSLAAKREGYD